MGCSASKPGPNGEENTRPASGFGPFRFNEIKRRNRNKPSGTLSTRELLNDDDRMSPVQSKRSHDSYHGDREESQIKDPEIHDHEKKVSELSDERRITRVPGETAESDEKTVSGVSGETGDPDEIKKLEEPDEKNVSGGSVGKKDHEIEVAAGMSEEEEEEEVVVELGFGDVPSSPSFREYFKSANDLVNGDSGKVKGCKEGRDSLLFLFFFLNLKMEDFIFNQNFRP